MKKKIKTSVIGLAIMAFTIAPAYAEETQIEATVESTYTLTIPAKTNIAYNSEETLLQGLLKVTGNVLPTQSIEVSVTAHALHDSTRKADIPYTLKNGKDVFTKGIWDEPILREGLAGEGKGKEVQLSVVIEDADWKKAPAGKYAGSIVFEAKLVTK